MTFTLPSPRTPDPMDAPPLRWGVLGTGWIAGRFVEALHAHTRQRVVVVGSRTPAKGAEFATEHGIERSVEGYEAVAAADLDVVYVATPHSEHRDNALLAIAAGKHVLIEKAFTRNLAEATEVVEQFKEDLAFDFLGQHLLMTVMDFGTASVGLVVQHHIELRVQAFHGLSEGRCGRH